MIYGNGAGSRYLRMVSFLLKRYSRKAWAADIRRTHHIGDFTRWKESGEYQKAFARLLLDLRASSKKKKKKKKKKKR